MNDLGIGQLIREPKGRDAIHVAIAPVTAGEFLSPGEHVGFLSNGTVGENAEVRIGIIDPFLTETVPPGQKCWLFLYPGTVTSLRHVWTHPAFPPAKAPGGQP